MNRNFRNNADFSSIENEINTIYGSLAMRVPEGGQIVHESPKRGAANKGSITIYGDSDKKVMIEKYVFYPGILQPSKLASVAIYGNDVATHYTSLKTGRTLFGHRVRRVKMEMGRRPFIDVILA